MATTKNFHDFSKLISNDKLRPTINFAIVENGYLIATNSYGLAIGDLRKFVKDDQICFLENKVFSADLVKRLANSKENIFFENHIICKDKKGVTKLNYTGKMKDQVIEIYDEFSDNFKFVGKYPNWAAVIPGFDKNTFKIDFSIYQDNQPVRGINASLINAVSTALNSECFLLRSQQANRANIAFLFDEKKNEIDFSVYCLVMPVALPPQLIEALPEPAAKPGRSFDSLKLQSKIEEAEKLEAENKALKNEISELMKKASDFYITLDSLNAEILKLRAENEELKKHRPEPAAAPEPAEPAAAPVQILRTKRAKLLRSNRK